MDVVKSKTEKLDELFVEWIEHHNSHGLDEKNFCEDGIIDEKYYGKNGTPKTLFVLRETNNYGGDLREFLKEGPKYQIYHTLSRWAAGIHKGFPTFDKIDKIKMMTEEIKSTAVMNIKKHAGKSQTIINH